jgi:hypothetical protein
MKSSFGILSLVLLVLMSVTSSTCKKDSKDLIPKIDELPQETQVGKNTFGCLVDGEIWISTRNYTNIYNNDQFWVYNYPLFRGISIVAKKSDKNPQESFTLFSKNIYGAGRYKLGKYFDPYVTSYNNQQTFIISDTVNSLLNITKYDTINRIISGEFNFKFLKDNKTINVTNGVFDIKY